MPPIKCFLFGFILLFLLIIFSTLNNNSFGSLAQPYGENKVERIFPEVKKLLLYNAENETEPTPEPEPKVTKTVEPLTLEKMCILQ